MIFLCQQNDTVRDTRYRVLTIRDWCLGGKVQNPEFFIFWCFWIVKTIFMKIHKKSSKQEAVLYQYGDS